MTSNLINLFFVAIGVLAIFVYLLAVRSSNQHYKKWPSYRSLYWVMGVFSAEAALVGPIATQAHHNFAVHMVGHLLLGMLAPLLLVLSAPVTLILRSLSISKGRRLSKMLKSRFVKFVGDPFVASVLNIGGLWLLYTTELYSAMHHHVFLHLLIHFHVFLAGYLFTASMIYIDPISHRRSYLYRGIVLVIALSGHGILSKYIYGTPPVGVPSIQAEQGGMLMYYGGDAIDLVLIFIYWLQWYKGNRPRESQDLRESI
ncbi:cytochrome c oxidase assembly protein [Mesobacillus maritimus]|uniref:Cytochrome c oxidase assembly protein n=1 Tax=Mesobacillus maritimus TaxID=1643336 RepID=A0ABS7K188_9BACI|nr:cytochrome c oxidase assembly protein [Mesobacillus maritimus]MBY0096024.1 cytochrome c oxidase assembly protein [Mesobacillus maritimus]